MSETAEEYKEKLVAVESADLRSRLTAEHLLFGAPLNVDNIDELLVAAYYMGLHKGRESVHDLFASDIFVEPEER